MRRHIIFLSIAISFSCSFLQGVSAEEMLTWRECVQEAIKKHPDLIAAEAKLNQAKADKAIAASGLLPQISSDLRLGTSESTDRNRTDTYSYGVTLQQLLFDGFKTPYDIAAALKKVQSAQYNYEVTSSDLRLRLRTAFVELLKSQELLTITEDILIRRKQNVDLVRLRYEGGREHKGALLTAQANLAQAEFEVSKAKRNINVAQRRLSKELGRSELRPIRTIGDFKGIDLKRERPDLELLAANVPSLKTLIADKEAAKLGVRSAQANFFPQVYAEMSAGRADSNWPPENDEWSVGVNLSFPLFEGGRRLAEVSKAKAVMGQAEADERSGRDSVILVLEESWTNLQDTIDTVEVQRKFLQAAQERSKIAQAQYSNGLISFDNWTIIEDDFVRVQKSFLDAQANAFIAEAQWINSQGGTLEYEE